jgi:hypothetical protein
LPAIINGMIINHYGLACVKIQFGETVIAFNPISKDFDNKAPKFGADIALSSLNDPAFNGRENTAFGTKVPFFVDGPGEYEVGGTFILGFPSKGPENSINTIYTLTVDGIRICHLGGLASAEIDPDIIEKIGAIDILFLPIGGKNVLTPKEAVKLSANLEPKVVVPTMYSLEKNDPTLQTFLKEAGESKIDFVDKLTVKKKDLEGKEAEIILIKSI